MNGAHYSLGAIAKEEQVALVFKSFSLKLVDVYPTFRNILDMLIKGAIWVRQFRETVFAMVFVFSLTSC